MNNVFRSTLSITGDAISHKLEQPSEAIILERNKALRASKGALHDLGAKSEEGTWGRQVASIPLILFERAIKDGFDLTNKDPHIANLEMSRFLASSMGKACLV